jgi:hypothetical protein
MVDTLIDIDNQRFALDFSRSDIHKMLHLLKHNEQKGLFEIFESQLKKEKGYTPITTPPKSYKEFKTLDELEDILQLSIFDDTLFTDIQPITPSERLQIELDEAVEMGFVSEKERCELIIMPILKELRRRNNQQFRIYSGRTLNAAPEKGLKGECDFMLSLEKDKKRLQPPIFVLLEAKKDDIEGGIIQCIAQMYGAKIYNAKKENPVSKIYGCVSTGETWQFISLEENKIRVDTQRHYFNEMPIILGVLQMIVDTYLKN